MVEALLWGFIGVVGIIGAIIGVAAAYQMGHRPYRDR
jgi:hypothetical protein